MVPAGRDREAAREAVFVVGRVAEAGGDVDVDAAERVDDADEPAEVDLGEVVDLEVEERAERAHQHVVPGAVAAREVASGGAGPRTAAR